MKRREFIKAAAAGAGAIGLSGGLLRLFSGFEKEKQETGIKKLLTIELIGAFPKNEAEFGKGIEGKFEALLVEFFQKYSLSEGKIQELSQARIRLEVSSDERPTKTWKGGNQELSEQRERVLKRLYRRVISSQRGNFPKLQSFFQKRPNTDMAVSPTHGRGVTSLNQLTRVIRDEKTGIQKEVKYTVEDLDELSQADKEDLYDKCRYVRLVIELPTEKERDIQYEKLDERLADFKVVRFLLDSSDSMADECQRLGRKIFDKLVRDPKGSGFSDHNNAIATFEQSIHWGRYVLIKSKEDLERIIKNIGTAGGDEHQLLAIEQMAGKLNEEFVQKKRKKENNDQERQSSAILMLSDEGMNDFDPEKLRKLVAVCKKNKITIFLAFINGANRFKLLTLTDAEGLLKEFDDFVDSFDSDVYFPKDGMSREEKKRYLLERMNEYTEREKQLQQQNKITNWGVQLDANGNIRFKFNTNSIRNNLDQRMQNHNESYKAFKQNLDTEYKQKKAHIEDWGGTRVYSSMETARKKLILDRNYWTLLRRKHDKYRTMLLQDKKMSELIDAFWSVHEGNL